MSTVREKQLRFFDHVKGREGIEKCIITRIGKRLREGERQKDT